MPATKPTRPAKPKAAKPGNPNCAAMFDLVLPNGTRLGDASVADLEAAIIPYASMSSRKGQLCRELLELARKFEAGAYR